MTIYGTLCGYTDFTNMVDFLTLNENYFIKLLNLKNGIPSHDTFSRVLAQINPNKFMEVFIRRIKEIIGTKGLHISIDGKAIKSTRDKINNGNVPYILSGFFCDIVTVHHTTDISLKYFNTILNSLCFPHTPFI